MRCSVSAARRADIFLTLPQWSTARPTYRNKDQDMKDFSLDFDPTTESYTDMSFDSILSQYKLESYQDA